MPRMPFAHGVMPILGALCLTLLSGCSGLPARTSSAQPLALASGPHASASMGPACPGQVRTHYVAVDEVDWDYAPLAKNAVTGRNFTADEAVFVAPGEGRVGSVYHKAVYREYADGTFATPLPRDAKWES